MPKKKRKLTINRRENPKLGLMSAWQDAHKPLILLSLSLFAIGLMMVASASVVLASDDGLHPLHYVVRQLIWVGIGLLVAFLAYQLPLKLVAKLAPLGMLVSIGLLIAVLFVGTEIFGATRWIDLGPFDLQPSELAKIGLLVYLAAWLARPRPQHKNKSEALNYHFWHELVPFLLMLAIVSVLIVLQPDLDTAVIIGGSAIIVYYVSGRDVIHSLGTLMIFIVGALSGVVAALIAPYRLERVQTYYNFLTSGQFGLEERQGSGFQIFNSLVAIAEGGIWGQGYGQSTGKLFYLSNAAFTDSIFSVIAEEFGLIGSIAVIIAFLYFMNIGITIARNAPDKFSALLAVGVTSWITFQAFLNIGANLAVIPFGGIPLPFISYGGSSTIAVCLGVGLLLNVHRHSR